ncbi:MAG: FkbM family methyltransferase [Cyclobacteriaceae bacterium]|nr:FkbM family methyltransferase [Cyclobacteriaceae bacterium SS2]
MLLKGLFGFKVIFKGAFEILSKKSGRKFVRLSIGHGERERYRPGTFKLHGRKFQYADNMSFLWQFHDIFVKEVYKFQTNNAQPLIIDCGSNIGLSVLYFKKQYPNSRVIAFEADPDIFDTQIKNLSHLEGVESHNEAVWTDDIGIKLFRNKADGAYISDGGDIQVNSVRLRDFLKAYDHIDLLKLDVEGAEFDLIKDCKDELHRVEKLFVEIHTFSGQQQHMAELLTTIESAGFRYFIENANYQNSPLTGSWRSSDTGMDMQLNLYAIRE